MSHMYSCIKYLGPAHADDRARATARTLDSRVHDGIQVDRGGLNAPGECGWRLLTAASARRSRFRLAMTSAHLTYSTTPTPTRLRAAWPRPQTQGLSAPTRRLRRV